MKRAFEPCHPAPTRISLSLSAALAAAVAISFAAACGNSASPGAEVTGETSVPNTSITVLQVPSVPVAVAGDATRGGELMVKFECDRCHEGVDRASSLTLPARPPSALTPESLAKEQNRHCFRCHAQILDGKHRAPKAATTERWKTNVELLREVPTLRNVAGRFKRSWIEAFLRSPHDLRPRLVPSMPKLALKEQEVKDIAAFLVPNESPETPIPAATPESLALGRDLFEKKGCVSCHVISGAQPFKTSTSVKEGERGISSALRLAPDLRYARDRMAFVTIVKWIQKPSLIKPDTQMPETPMSEDEAQKIATFLVGETLQPLAPKPIPTRLPPLTRRVSYEEVKAKVFNKICWHCHSDGDYTIGDDGPGNSGGFGYVPRGLNLASHDGIHSGSLDDAGERRSIFEPLADGTPRLLAALLARWTEEAGQENPAIRGMPMGMPGLSPDDVQLVETWIAQGHGAD